MNLRDKLYSAVQNANARELTVTIVAYFAAITYVPALMSGHGPASWVIWAVLLLAQNFAFTFVSRARSSGSLLRHLKAAIMSNGIWIVSQVILLGPMFDKLTGKQGRPLQVLTEVVYTVATVTGSLVAHYWALRTERGKTAVGASRLYAQIPVAEWGYVRQTVAKLGTLYDLEK
jgi:hypothetical protein